MSWSINGTSIPAPLTNDYSVEQNDIDSSQTGRLDNGYMFRERIRTGVYKVSFTWNVTAYQCNVIKSLLSSTPNITVTFKDGSNWVTKNMYCSKITKKCVSPFGEELWKISANCEEV